MIVLIVVLFETFYIMASNMKRIQKKYAIVVFKDNLWKVYFGCDDVVALMTMDMSGVIYSNMMQKRKYKDLK